MKVLILSTSSNNTNTVIDSLRYLDKHEVVVMRYDDRFLKTVDQVTQTSPNLKPLILTHQWPVGAEREPWLKRCSMDEDMLNAAKTFKPDAIIYISAWVGDFVPSHETLGELNSIAPMVHMCFDAADPPWWRQMKQFEEKRLFKLTVTIDGAKLWPGSNEWIDQSTTTWFIKNALTLLTPVDPRCFEGNDLPSFSVRPYPVGYAGNAGGWIRSWLVQQMSQHHTDIFAYRARDDHPDSYKLYCTFLRHCKTVFSIPFTGSGATTHVKGRVVEAGYAGACLLEWKNPATASWFTPRADYWEYESVEECREMSQFLAHHPKLCEEMAGNLHHRVTTEHSPEMFWGKVFERIS